MCKMSCLVALFRFSNKSLFVFFLENVNNEPIVKKQNKKNTQKFSRWWKNSYFSCKFIVYLLHT